MTSNHFATAEIQPETSDADLSTELPNSHLNEVDDTSSSSEADLPKPVNPTSDEFGTPLSGGETRSMQITIGSAAACFAIALLTTSSSLFIFHAIAVGALGGLFHELAQSGGKIFFFRKAKDGLYLGSMTGMVLGVIAGLLVARSYTPPQARDAAAIDRNQPASATQAEPFDVGLSLEIFFAALGLKGVAEAATSSPTSKDDKER